MSSELQLDVCCRSCCGGDIWWTHTKERQAWCYLQVKLCDPRLNALSVVATIKALYKYTSFLFLSYTEMRKRTLRNYNIIKCHVQNGEKYNRRLIRASMIRNSLPNSVISDDTEWLSRSFNYHKPLQMQFFWALCSKSTAADSRSVCDSWVSSNETKVTYVVARIGYSS